MQNIEGKGTNVSIIRQTNARHHSTTCWQHSEETQSATEDGREGVAHRKRLGLRLISSKEQGPFVNFASNLWKTKRVKKSQRSSLGSFTQMTRVWNDGKAGEKSDL